MSHPKKKTGFAALSPEVLRELASRGGRAAHELGHARKWSAAEARAAGEKGGLSVSRDAAHMSQIGRIGGEAMARLKRAESERR